MAVGKGGSGMLLMLTKFQLHLAISLLAGSCVLAENASTGG